MDHRVALAFEDGVTRFITCRDDQTVADASYRARINIPLDCRDGACGTCKALCESGEFDGGTYLEDALSDDEAQSGYVLPCSMKPRSDLVLQIATTSAVAKTSAATHRGRITALDRLSPTTVGLTVEIDDRDSLAFLPGQYVNIAVPGTEESRSYSFSSAPQDKELTFLVKLTPGGVMSTWLEERAGVGDEITFTGPHGSFFLRESDAPLLLLAGGTGLAPILSVLRTLEGNRSDRQMHLVYGVTTDDDLVEMETIEQLAGAIEGLTWDYCVADPATKAPNQGYVTGLYGPEHLHDGGGAVYLCGPPPMVEAVRTHVAGLGVTPSGFYYEKFALAAAPTEAAEEVVEPEPEAVVPESQEVAPEPPPVSVVVPDTVAELLALDGREGRTSAGQDLFPPVELPPLGADVAGPRAESPADLWRLAGQQVGDPFPTGDVLPVDDADDLVLAVGARAVAGQEMLPEVALEQLTPPAPEASAGQADVDQSDAEIEPAFTAEGYSITGDGYEIGEEHPSVHESDAIFDARRALELGALELTIGRLTHQQLVGYRVLAEATVPYVEGDRFVDAAAYTETNAAFHDYLFTLTGNEHLLRAYQALGVKGHMEESLRSATWCHPRCAQDHLDIVEAFRDGDRERARVLVTEHAERSKETTRRAMHDLAAGRRPRFVTPGRFAGQVVVVTGAGQGIGERTARRIRPRAGPWCWPTGPSWSATWPVSSGSPGPRRSPSSQTWRPGRARSRLWTPRCSGSAASTSPSTPSAAPSGPSRSSTTRPTRSRPRSTGPCGRRCGAAAPSCRTWSSGGRARSSTSHRWPPGGSTASRTRRPRAGSTPSPPRWPSRWPRTACGSSPPPPAGPTPRRAACRAGPRRRPRWSSPGTGRSSTRRSIPR